MTPEQRRAIQIQASHAAPPTSAPTAPPQPIPAPNPTTGLFGNPPPGHPLSAAPGPAPAAPAALSGAAARPGRAAAIAPPGTARGFGSTQVQFVGQGGANPAVPGAPEVRTRGAGRIVAGPNIGARVEVDSNATRRGGAVPTQPGQVSMQGHAPQAIAAPVAAAGQWMGGSAIPQAMPSAATTSIADLTIILSQHTRPGFLERQIRTLQSSSVRAAAMCCFVNPVQGVQIQDSLLQGIPKIRADRDTGPWMRWTTWAAEIATRYTLVLDDDCIFGTTWLQRAMERIIFSESQGQRIVVVAGGIVYTDDNWSSVFPIGPESPPPLEQQVDIGRGAWLLPTELLQEFLAYPRLGSAILTIPMHFAAAMQFAGVPTIALDYPLNDRAAWGMSQPPTADGSMSKMLDSLAAAQRGNSSAWHREEGFNAYRAAGWRPLVVQKAEQETIREPVAALGVDLGAPPAPAPVPVPVPAPSATPST